MYMNQTVDVENKRLDSNETLSIMLAPRCSQWMSLIIIRGHV